MYSSQEYWSNTQLDADAGDPILYSLKFDTDRLLTRPHNDPKMGNSNWCLSLWYKIGSDAGIENPILTLAVNNGAENWPLAYNNGQFSFKNSSSDSYASYSATNFQRDSSGWYHLFLKAENTEPYYNTIYLYVNGSEQSQSAFMQPVDRPIVIGAETPDGVASAFNRGRIADMYFVQDNPDLQATDFGRLNKNGIWVPKRPGISNDTRTKLSVNATTAPGEVDFTAGREAHWLFDGREWTYAAASGVDNYLWFEPTTPIYFNDTLEVYSRNSLQRVTHAGNVVDFGENAWTTVTTGGGEISESFPLKWEGLSNNAFWANSIRLDGVPLIEAYTYSTYLTTNGTFDQDVSGPERAFRGSLSDPGAMSGNTGGTLTWAPVPAIPVNSTVEVFCYAGNTSANYIAAWNGNQANYTNGTWVTVSSGVSGEISAATPLTITADASDQAALAGIRIDGKQIVEGINPDWGPNGFHLDWSYGNDFGRDMSPNGNDFDAIGFEYDMSNPYASRTTDTPTNNCAAINQFLHHDYVYNNVNGGTILTGSSSNGGYCTSLTHQADPAQDFYFEGYAYTGGMTPPSGGAPCALVFTDGESPQDYPLEAPTWNFSGIHYTMEEPTLGLIYFYYYAQPAGEEIIFYSNGDGTDAGTTTPKISGSCLSPTNYNTTPANPNYSGLARFGVYYNAADKTITIYGADQGGSNPTSAVYDISGWNTDFVKNWNILSQVQYQTGFLGGGQIGLFTSPSEWLIQGRPTAPPLGAGKPSIINGKKEFDIFTSDQNSTAVSGPITQVSVSNTRNWNGTGNMRLYGSEQQQDVSTYSAYELNALTANNISFTAGQPPATHVSITFDPPLVDASVTFSGGCDYSCGSQSGAAIPSWNNVDFNFAHGQEVVQTAAELSEFGFGVIPYTGPYSASQSWAGDISSENGAERNVFVDDTVTLTFAQASDLDGFKVGDIVYKSGDANYSGQILALSAGSAPYTMTIGSNDTWNTTERVTTADILNTMNTAFPNGMYLIKDRENYSQWQFIDTVNGLGAAASNPDTSQQQPYLPPTGASVGYAWRYNPANPAANGFDIKMVGSQGTDIIVHGLGDTPDFVLSRNTYTGGGMRAHWRDLGYSSTLFCYNNAPASSDTEMLTAANDTTITYQGKSGDDYRHYLWKSIPGFSRFGSYEPTSEDDGTFVHLDFKPALLIIKSASTEVAWMVVDSHRSPANPTNARLFLNTTTPEGTGYKIDLLANGFKIRAADSATNYIGYGPYMFAAWAENPFSFQVPPTAR